MDNSSLQFHRAILRLLKGCLSSYEQWLSEQEAVLVVESLKARKADLSREPPTAIAKDKTTT